MIEFGYWDIRGYAEVTRLLLKYFGVDYKDIRYPFGDNNDRKPWLDVKFTLGLDFPNLPYVIDGDFKLSQSQAVTKYLANKYGMIKRDMKEKAIEEMLEYTIIDFRNTLVRTAYYKEIPDDAALKKEKEALGVEFKESIKTVEKFIGTTKKFLTGDELSYVDFLAYEYLGWYRELICKNIFDDLPNLQRFFKNFEEIPALKSYLASPEYRKAGIMSPFAKFGYVRD